MSNAEKKCIGDMRIMEKDKFTEPIKRIEIVTCHREAGFTMSS